jgi:isopenicillin N synthase-like dioxygenase
MAADIPVIDIAPFLDGNGANKARVARAVNRACEDTGFFIIVGHSVPESLISAVMGISRDFFDLSETEKLKSAPPHRSFPRGYSRMMDESLAYSAEQAAPPDIKEAFAIGQVDVPNAEYYHCAAAGMSFVANIWPERPESLREIWTNYFRAMEGLAADLMEIFAVALDLKEDFFDDKLDKAVSVLRALNYPNLDFKPLPGQLRAGEHTDFGSLTVLLQEGKPGGLQVLTRSGRWVDAQPVPNSFTVNIGDLMQIWTNDRWISNMHRVANPPFGTTLDCRRQAIAFFQQPNYDTLVSCLASCQGPDRPPKYAPVTSGDHMHMKIMRTRTMSLEGRA